jgi:hypothetical protein
LRFHDPLDLVFSRLGVLGLGQLALDQAGGATDAGHGVSVLAVMLLARAVLVTFRELVCRDHCVRHGLGVSLVRSAWHMEVLEMPSLRMQAVLNGPNT